jgi:hypothetical protein
MGTIARKERRPAQELRRDATGHPLIEARRTAQSWPPIALELVSSSIRHPVGYS